LPFLSHWYLVSFFKAFVLTVLVEFLVFYPFARGIRTSKAFGAVLLVNAFSLPIVWFVIPFWVNSYPFYTLSAELFAFLSETLLLKALLPLSFKRIIAASITMNLGSFVIGWMFPFLTAP